MLLHPNAKINLGLNVVSKRPDGYHNLETVFLPIDITDELEVNISEIEDVPSEDNLVTKAYRLLQKYYTLPPLCIRITKHIPMQAGLGGGSSDAAYTLKAINEICNLNITTEQLERYAAMLGADCALFIKAETAYATGIGDVLSSLPFPGQLMGKTLLLVKPDVAVSTKEAYAGITPRQSEYNCREVLQQPISVWREQLVNDFEVSIFPKLPILSEIKQQLYNAGALYAAMSGSGSTIFGIFDTTPNIESFTQYAYTKIIKF